MTSQEIRFVIRIGANTKELTFEDTSPYSALEKFSSGLLKITNSADSTVYKNTGYDTDNYEKPDIINAVSGKSITDAIAMFIGEDGQIAKDTYTIDYKVRVYTNVVKTITGVTVEASSLKHIIMLAISANDALLLTQTGYVSIDSGVNVGEYKITNSVYAAGDLLIEVENDLTAQTTVDTDFNVPSTYEDLYSTKNFGYCYTAPTVKIGYDITCNAKTLESIDNTDYRANINAIWLAPTTAARVHTVVPPAGSGYPAIPDTSDKIRKFADIWTKMWQTSIVTSLTYEVEQWDTTWYYLTDSVNGSSDAEVKCTDCTCDMSACLSTLYGEWQEAMKSNPIAAKQLGTDVAAVNMQYMLYKQAQSCGAPTDTYCETISTILKRNNCDCPSEDDKGSVPVESDDSQLMGGGGAEILMGVINPYPNLGADGDMYINTQTSTYYYKVSGVWIYKGSIMGATGYDGEGWTGASYDSATGRITFVSDDGLGFTTGDLRGSDGASIVIIGQDTAANIITKSGNVNDLWISTTVGVDSMGTAVAVGDGLVYDGTNWLTVGQIRGDKGDGWTGVTYDNTTGKLTFTSDDGLDYVSDKISPVCDTNGKTVTKAVGSISAGLTFTSDKEVCELWDDALFGYVAPSLNSITVSPNTDVEVGTVINMVSANIVWARDSEDHAPYSMNIVGDGFLSETIPTTGTSATVGADAGGTSTRTSAGANTWTFTGDDKDGNSLLYKHAYVQWYFKNVFGASSTILTSANLSSAGQSVVEDLQQDAFDTNRMHDWSTTADNKDATKYTYIAYPAAYGDISSIKQGGATTITGAFEKLGDFSYTNAKGVSVSMRVYKKKTAGGFEYLPSPTIINVL